MVTMRALVLAAAALAGLTVSAPAQDYPTRPVRIVVPFAPGALNDSVARTIADRKSTRLNSSHT